MDGPWRIRYAASLVPSNICLGLHVREITLCAKKSSYIKLRLSEMSTGILPLFYTFDYLVDTRPAYLARPTPREIPSPVGFACTWWKEMFSQLLWIIKFMRVIELASFLL